MKEFILVFIGSGFGGVVRFGLSKYFSVIPAGNFPLSTLIINGLACLLMGFLLKIFPKYIETEILYWGLIGFCGGFSTFSTFTNENIKLLENGEFMVGLIYIFGSIMGCIVMMYWGSYLGKLL